MSCSLYQKAGEGIRMICRSDGLVETDMNNVIQGM